MATFFFSLFFLPSSFRSAVDLCIIIYVYESIKANIVERWIMCIGAALFSLYQCVPTAFIRTRLHQCAIHVWAALVNFYSVLDGFVWLTNTNNTSNDNPLGTEREKKMYNEIEKE